jgi:thiosulfate/3-mercaptopyruvate sulfurtransferase
VRPRHDVVVGAAEVAAALGQSDVALIDARHTVFYEGRDTNHVRPGHLPGARNVPFTAMVDSTGFLLPPVRLSTLFEAAGAAPGDRVVTYCHIGQQASLVWFAARLLGYDARLYDGSFTEWTTLPQYPVERTP